MYSSFQIYRSYGMYIIKLFLILIALLTSTINAQSYKLTILHSNDAKSKLIKPGQAGQSDFGSVSRMKTLYDTLISRAQRNGFNVINLSAGNNLLASPEFFISQQLPEGQDYYDSRALNMINFDAVGFGNHEFDFGPDVTARFIGGFQNQNTNFISSNLDFSQEDSLNNLISSGKIRKYKIIQEGGEKIGILAVISPELKTLSSPRRVTVDPNVVDIINNYVDTLTNLGVNKIILISNYQGVKQDSVLIRNTRGIDVVVSAHDYDLLANPGTLLVPGDSAFVVAGYPLTLLNSENETVYLVKTGPEYKYVGKLELEFNSLGDVVQIGNGTDLIRVASDTYPDGVMKNQNIETSIITPLQNSLNALAGNVIGTSQVELDGLIGHIRTRETNLGNLAADALLWEAKQLASVFGAPQPDISLQNGGGIRNNNIIPSGNLSELTTFSILPFGNFTSIVEGISPSQLKEILENAVSRVENVEGRFAQISGFKLKFNPNAQAQMLDNNGNILIPGKRIWEIKLNNGEFIVQNGEVNLSAPLLNISISDFLAKGGDQYPFRGAQFSILGSTDQQSLANYIQQGLSGLISSSQYPEGGEGRIVSDPTLETGEKVNQVKDYELVQNFPNPFNPETVITWSMKSKENAVITICDILGREVSVPVNGVYDPGTHSVRFNGKNLSSGIYTYTLKVGDRILSRKMLLMK